MSYTLAGDGGTHTFAANIVSIDPTTFSGITISDIVSIVIPTTVTSIGDYTFDGCSLLSSVTFETESLCSSIGTWSFANCSALTSIAIPKSVTSIGNAAFILCGLLASVTFDPSSTITSIGESVFQACFSLTSVTIPTTVTSIGDYAFANSQITSITIPKTVTRIGSSAFLFCSAMESVTFEPDSLCSSIDLGVFQNCFTLTSITIPKSVTSIGLVAFFFCYALESVIFESGSVCSSIGANAFGRCITLTNIAIPNSVTSIGDMAFMSCDALTRIVIPKSLTSISYAVFFWCGLLESVTFEPDSICSSISDQVFWSCSALTSIVIPPSVTSIAREAFLYSGLGNVYISSNLSFLSDTFNDSFNLILSDSYEWMLNNSVVSGTLTNSYIAVVASAGPVLPDGTVSLVLTCAPHRIRSTSFLSDIISAAADQGQAVLDMVTTLPYSSSSSIVTAVVHWLLQNSANTHAGAIYAGLASKYTSVTLASSDAALINSDLDTAYTTLALAFGSVEPSLWATTVYILADGSYTIGGTAIDISNGAVTDGPTTVTTSGKTYNVLSNSPFTVALDTTAGTVATQIVATPTATLILTVKNADAAVSMLTTVAADTSVPPTNILAAALTFTSSTDKTTSLGIADTNAVYTALASSFAGQVVTLSPEDSASIISTLSSNSTVPINTIPSNATITVAIPQAITIGGITTNSIPVLSSASVAYIPVPTNVSTSYNIDSSISAIDVDGTTGGQKITAPGKPDQPLVIGEDVKIWTSATAFYTYHVYFLGSMVVDTNGVTYDISNGVFTVTSGKPLGVLDLSDPLFTGITSIGANAFADCSGLTGIIIPAAVTSVAAGAFSGCSGLQSISLSGTIAFANGAFSPSDVKANIILNLLQGSIWSGWLADLYIGNNTVPQNSLNGKTITPSQSTTTLYPGTTGHVTTGHVTTSHVTTSTPTTTIPQGPTTGAPTTIDKTTLHPGTTVHVTTGHVTTGAVYTFYTIGVPPSESETRLVDNANNLLKYGVVFNVLTGTSDDIIAAAILAASQNKGIYTELEKWRDGQLAAWNSYTLSTEVSEALAGQLGELGLPYSSTTLLAVPITVGIPISRNNISYLPPPPQSGSYFIATASSKTYFFDDSTRCTYSITSSNGTITDYFLTPSTTNSGQVSLGSTIYYINNNGDVTILQACYVGCSGYNVVSSSQPPIPCFLAAAPVLTPNGYRRIDSLNAGDLVLTDTGASVAIERVSKTTVTACPANYPYTIPKGRFGAMKTLSISPNHKIQVDGKMIEARFLGLERKEMVGTFDYYNLELPDYEKMVVAGVTVESLYPVSRITMTAAEFKQALINRYGNIGPEILAAAMSKVRQLADGRFVVPVDKRIYNKIAAFSK